VLAHRHLGLSVVRHAQAGPGRRSTSRGLRTRRVQAAPTRLIA
jgi:hypothetical protein